VQDRHQNRAHIYEKNSAGTAKMLDHDESRGYFEYFQGVLNDLALVAFGAKWSLHDMNIMSSEADAQDLVDQLILTRQARRKIDRGDIERDALYDALHADPHDRDGKPAFNSAKAIFNVLAKRGLVKPLSD
jgi:hypothetical protein